jgi:hypothetical protein
MISLECQYKIKILITRKFYNLQMIVWTILQWSKIWWQGLHDDTDINKINININVDKFVRMWNIPSSKSINLMFTELHLNCYCINKRVLMFYICTYIHIYIWVYIYIYVYTERGRERWICCISETSPVAAEHNNKFWLLEMPYIKAHRGNPHINSWINKVDEDVKIWK